MQVLLLFVTIWLGQCIQGSKPVYTQVTYLHDLERFGNSGLSNEEMMLQSDENMIIFGPKEIEFLISQKRKERKTVFIPLDIHQLTKQWYFPYFQKLHPSINSEQDEKKTHTLAKHNLVSMAKIFLLAQALKHDKFLSDFFIWTDADSLYQTSQNPMRPEEVLKYFYQLVQPNWIFFTKYSQKQREFPKSHGEQKYINRRLMIHEQVVPSFMGGNVHSITDIKNSYESFLRIILEDPSTSSERYALSLMPIRFPSLIPSTVSINLTEITDKIHIYNELYRVSKRVRYFKGSFEKNGQIRVKQSKFAINYQTKINIIQENMIKAALPQQSILQTRKDKVSEMQTLSSRFLGFATDKRFVKVKAFALEIFSLGGMIIAYIKLLIKNINLKREAQQSIEKRKAKDISYMKLSDQAHEPQPNHPKI